MARRIRVALLALILAAVPLAVVSGKVEAAGQAETAPPAAPAGSENIGFTDHLEQEGIRVDFHLEPLHDGVAIEEGADVAFSFRITDTTTGMPISGAYPAAWMDLYKKDAEMGEDQCNNKLKSFLSGSLLTQPELDLNVYYVLAMNSDGTISVVDPLFGFGGSKLLDMVILQSPAEDWVLGSDRRLLFVTLPDAGKVALVDTANWQVSSNLAVGTEPRRIAAQPDGQYIWVGVDGSESGRPPGVSVLSAKERRIVAHIPTGAGRHDLAFSDDSRYVFVTNEDVDTVSVIDIRQLAKVADVATGARPVSVAYSAMARAAYVVNEKAGTLTVVDGLSHKSLTEINVEPGITAIRFAPGQRLALVPNPETNYLHVIDAASNRLLKSGEMEEGPEQVIFTDTLAYVSHSGSEIVLMLPLDQLAVEGEPLHVVDFPGGQSPVAAASRPSVADHIVQTPGANAVLVANPGDQEIYFYKEGMAAPMGSFKNYGREPRAVMVVDRRLRERSSGTYQTEVRLRRPGTYDVAFFMDAPRVIHCFRVEVAESPTLRARRLAMLPVLVQPIIEERQLTTGKVSKISFLLTNPRTGEPEVEVEDAEVLSFMAPGMFQRRTLARSEGGGVYSIDLLPPEDGIYYVSLYSQSLGLSLRQAPALTLEARSDWSATEEEPVVQRDSLPSHLKPSSSSP
jgi:YVTN family beta-propeller protein